MAYSMFIPKIWAARLLAHLDNRHVFANLFNRDYEGEIKAYGDTVYINQIGPVTIFDYDGSDIGAPEEITGNTRTLTIDQGKGFNFQVKDIDRVQSLPNLMEGALDRASYGMTDEIDTYLAGLCKAAATTGITVTKDDGEGGTATETVTALSIGSASTPKAITSDNAYDILIDMGVKMSEGNVPKEGRWVVVPPWFSGLLAKDPRFSGYGTDASRGTLTSGSVVGMVAGFEVHESNNVPMTPGASSAPAQYSIVAGTRAAGTYAEQLVELEAYRPEKNFSDAVKGLHVYGAKITDPRQLCVLTASYSAS